MGTVFDLLDDSDRPDPTHDRGSRSTTWTNTNSQEAMPGVATPLTWSFFFGPTELALRGAFCDLGILRRAEVTVPPNVDDRFIAAFCGRLAGSLDLMRRMGDQIPGSSGDAVEEQIFGHSRPGMESHRTWKRVPFILAKLPVAAVRAPRQLTAFAPQVTTWWQDATADPDGLSADAARALLQEAAVWAGRVVRPHTVVSMLGQGLYDQVQRLCAAAGMGGLELQLLSGTEAVEEAGLVQDLWAVSRDQLPLPVFLNRWGFHGPAEGELSSRSWREDPSPVDALLATYRRRTDNDAPEAIRTRVAAEQAAAEAKLLAALPRPRRLKGRFVLRQARRYIPMRELGRGTFLKTYDVARAMVRRLGADLVAAGRLDDPDDAFYLTLPELCGQRDSERDVVAFRRRRRALYETLDLPERWTGEPEVTVATAADAGAESAVAGLGVSAGTVTGRAVVVLEPDGTVEIDPGDILVCHTTDPSWSAFFMVAGGVVIDIGGPMSHGAIVSRELGIPCVINTRNGTKALRTGDQLRIDGSTGAVEILSRPPADKS